MPTEPAIVRPSNNRYDSTVAEQIDEYFRDYVVNHQSRVNIAQQHAHNQAIAIQQYSSLNMDLFSSFPDNIQVNSTTYSFTKSTNIKLLAASINRHIQSLNNTQDINLRESLCLTINQQLNEMIGLLTGERYDYDLYLNAENIEIEYDNFHSIVHECVMNVATNPLFNLIPQNDESNQRLA